MVLEAVVVAVAAAAAAQTPLDGKKKTEEAEDWVFGAPVGVDGVPGGVPDPGAFVPYSGGGGGGRGGSEGGGAGSADVGAAAAGTAAAAAAVEGSHSGGHSGGGGGLPLAPFSRRMYLTYEDVPKEQRKHQGTKKAPLLPTMFPPTADGGGESGAAALHLRQELRRKCCRVMPSKAANTVREGIWGGGR
jgi:hypothetical protein